VPQRNPAGKALNHYDRGRAVVAILTSTAIPAANPDWPKSLGLGTAAPGGVYYIYGEAVAKLLTESLKIDVNPVPTQGPVHNVKLVESGDAQLGMVTMGIALQGRNGKGDWTHGQQFRKMRATFPMYDTTFHVVVLRRSGISTIEQLDKKHLGVGPRAGTPGTYVPAIMEILGIAPQIHNESWVALDSEMLAGRRDALATMAGVPFPAVEDLEKREPITFIGLSSKQIESVRKAIPELSSSTLPARTYPSLEKDYATFGVYNFMIARDDLPDDLVYQVAKTVHENQARLVSAHPSASETLPQNVDKNTFLPFHPGAVRYYREIGIKIPDGNYAGNVRKQSGWQER
jgi:TRAP transporter TAXI family solute receptor